jgi:hypothetical protein
MANKLDISLAGVNADPESRSNLGKLMAGDYWWDKDSTPSFVVTKEPTNVADSNALVCLINGIRIGYIPIKFQRSVNAFILDAGFSGCMPFHIVEWGALSNSEGIFCVVSLVSI